VDTDIRHVSCEEGEEWRKLCHKKTHPVETNHDNNDTESIYYEKYLDRTKGKEV
jgi:hypothetical protein